MLRRLAFYFLLLFALPVCAEDTGSIAMQIVPLESFKPGREMHAIARLTHIVDGSPVLASELAVSHTKQFHLLIVDESLSDFQHVHPDMRELDHSSCPKWYSCNPGEYPFSWTPKYNLAYRAWADIMPLNTGRQEYAMATIPSGHLPADEETPHTASDTTQMDKYRFTLSFDTVLTATKTAIGHLQITRSNGKPLCGADEEEKDCLEPVLGAFAHIVGFNEDFKTVLHAHRWEANHE